MKKLIIVQYNALHAVPFCSLSHLLRPILNSQYVLGMSTAIQYHNNHRTS